MSWRRAVCARGACRGARASGRGVQDARGAGRAAKLLTAEEARSLALTEVLRPFAGLDPLQVSDYVAPLWEAARSDYDQRVRPAEARISEKLREHFGARLLPSLATALQNHESETADAAAQPHQVLREVTKYAELLRRPAVAIARSRWSARKWVRPRAVPLGHQSRVRPQRSGALLMGQENRGQTRTGRNTTEVVEGCGVGRAVPGARGGRGGSRGRARRYARAGNKLEGVEHDSADAKGSALVAESREIRRELAELKKQLFEEWQESIVDRLGDFKLDLGSKLMDLDSSDTGHVKLHYNSELVSLLREVRQLSALGFAIRRKTSPPRRRPRAGSTGTAWCFARWPTSTTTSRPRCSSARNR